MLHCSHCSVPIPDRAPVHISQWGMNACSAPCVKAIDEGQPFIVRPACCAFHGVRFMACGEPDNYRVCRVEVNHAPNAAPIVSILTDETKFPTLKLAEDAAWETQQGRRSIFVSYPKRF